MFRTTNHGPREDVLRKAMRATAARRTPRTVTQTPAHRRGPAVRPGPGRSLSPCVQFPGRISTSAMPTVTGQSQASHEHGPQSASSARKSVMPVSPSPSTSPSGVRQAARSRRKSMIPTARIRSPMGYPSSMNNVRTPTRLSQARTASAKLRAVVAADVLGHAARDEEPRRAVRGI